MCGDCGCVLVVFKDPWLEDLLVIDISHGMFPGDRVWDFLVLEWVCS